jgi:hypothetical protein
MVLTSRSKTNTALANIAPSTEMGRVPLACATFGVSRAGLYRLAGQGNVRLLKIGGRTLVDFSSVRAYLAGLPIANIRPPRKAQQPDAPAASRPAKPVVARTQRKPQHPIW